MRRLNFFFRYSVHYALCLFVVHLSVDRCFARNGAAQIPGVIHIDALEASSDEISIAESVGLAERKGIEVAVITPNDRATVEYGLPPLRRLLKASVSRESIHDFGVERYLETIQATNENVTSVITLDGAEVIPAYYWENGLFSSEPEVRNYHKHILVIGFERAEDYAGIPSMANGFGHTFDVRCLIDWWPLPILTLGLFLMIRARRIDAPDDPHSMRPGLITALAGAILLVNNVSTCAVYDPYHGDPGEGPYQGLIDYTDERNALTFWAHPEVSQRLSRPMPWPASFFADSVYFETTPYTSSLLETRGYTGFAIFEEGMYVVGKPGGVWDQVLLEYCAGLRDRPVWAIAEVDFEASHINEGIATSQTVFLTGERTRKGILDALRQGSMYARRGAGNGLKMDAFFVTDQEETKSAAQGGLLELTGSPRLHFQFTREGRGLENFSILVIRGGEVIRTVAAQGDTAFTVDDPVIGGSGTTFYRLIVMNNDWPVLASNPVFARIDAASETRSQQRVPATGAGS